MFGLLAWLRGEDARAAFNAEMEALAREGGTRFARGNIALQYGPYQSRKDLERARYEVRRRVERLDKYDRDSA